ncbi:hypothetical protein [Cupriavidus sp. a3]|uniref:hypothetical protein n=1 Tax=Cupriavidus sp. a3 TaxID=3242158 RepID=UPI003D9C0735
MHANKLFIHAEHCLLQRGDTPLGELELIGQSGALTRRGRFQRCRLRPASSWPTWLATCSALAVALSKRDARFGQRGIAGSEPYTSVSSARSSGAGADGLVCVGGGHAPPA